MKQIKWITFLIISLFIFCACSGVRVLNSKNEDFYSKEFIREISAIKILYQQGEREKALDQLKNIPHDSLSDSEKALKRNLIGVIYFSIGNFEQAIYNFELGLSIPTDDKSLEGQLQLNLASTYYKLKKYQKAYDSLKVIDFHQLRTNESEKYHKLKYRLAKKLEYYLEGMSSLMWMLESRKSLQDLKGNPYFEILFSDFIKLSIDDREKLLDPFIGKKFFAFSYLFYIHAEKLYYNGGRDKAKDYLEWMRDEFSDSVEIVKLVESFIFRINNYSKIRQNEIGIVLPLSGLKKKFGERALFGIDTAINDQSIKDLKRKFRAQIRDSRGSGAVGAYRVRELVEKHYVSVIIGGLFSDEAKREYLEAKKYGVLFISLSQVFLPKEQKDHLLIEIPGSVESQIERIFSPEFLQKFGKKVAMIYPQGTRGDAYVNAFWRYSEMNNVQVTGLASFEKGQTDYRGPVREILGLKYPRERQVEYDLLSEIYSLESSKNVRRIQVLKPQVDFDWIFIPAYPREALQLLPSFNYFDANKMVFVGGPSWRSEMIAKESERYGSINFVGDNVEFYNSEFFASYLKRNKRRPKLVEMRSYDAFKIVENLLGKKVFENREKFDQSIRNKKTIQAMIGNWKYERGVWIKDMAAMRIKAKKIDKVAL